MYFQGMVHTLSLACGMKDSTDWYLGLQQVRCIINAVIHR